MTPRELYEALRYQLAPVGISTWGHCAKEGCTNGARGSQACANCLAGELSAHIGPLADQLHDALLVSKLAIYRVEEAIEALDAVEPEPYEAPDAQEEALAARDAASVHDSDETLTQSEQNTGGRKP